MTLKVCVLGSGTWGTTMASLISQNTTTMLWARNSDLAQEIHWSHHNDQYLPGVNLPETLQCTDSIMKAVDGADVIVMAVPSLGFRTVLKRAVKHIRPWIPIVSLTKGLEATTLLRMTEVIQEELPGHPVGVLTGPNLADEIIQGYPAASVLAMKDSYMATELQKILGTEYFRVYTNTDVIGCELAGAFKNVIAIACGMADGMGAGDNVRAAFITRGMAESSRLGMAMGGNMESFSGLSGIGDMIATCTSKLSRNYKVGEQIASGKSLTEITQGMRTVAEGVNTTKTMLTLGERYKINLPITGQVNSVLHEHATVASAFRKYLRIHPGTEADPG